MGSRIMHLIIAARIADRLAVEDRAVFLLGGIAPDAVSTKEESHFFAGDHEDYTRHIDYGRFLEKYRSRADRPYILGYYAHLIADQIWLSGFYLSWLRNRMQADQELQQAYYNDFRVLNGQLIEHYGVRDVDRELLNHSSASVDLEEVSARDVAALIPYVLGDMEYDQAVIQEQLNVFTWNQIIGYIETSIEAGWRKITNIAAAQSNIPI